jgi:glycerol-3-phosphate dehydrogenase
MPQKLEDILARRTRLLFLDARAAMDCCELVAGYLQLALEKDEKWKLEQVREFKILAQQYLLS